MGLYRLVRLTLDNRGTTQRLGKKLLGTGTMCTEKVLLWQGESEKDPDIEFFVNQGLLIEVDPEDEGDLVDEINKQEDPVDYAYALEELKGRRWHQHPPFGNVTSEAEPVEELDLDNDPAPERIEFTSQND